MGLEEEDIRTPLRMAIKGVTSEIKSNGKDFRIELLDHMNLNDGEISFDLMVASKLNASSEDWRTIGKIVFNEWAISEGCDHRVHFHHPKFEKNLK